MISIDPGWLMKKMGINADPELTELLTIFSMRLSSAPDKTRFIKDALRTALGTGGNVVTGRR